MRSILKGWFNKIKVEPWMTVLVLTRNVDDFLVTYNSSMVFGQPVHTNDDVETTEFNWHEINFERILSIEARDMDTKLLSAPESNNTLARCTGFCNALSLRSVSPDGFLPSIMLLVIIVAVAIVVTVVLVVVLGQACASRVVATLSATSFLMAAWVIAGTTNIAGLQKKQMGYDDEVVLAHVRISTIEMIDEDIQVMQAHNVELHIQAPIAPSPSPVLSSQFDSQDFFLPKEILPPQKQARFLSYSSADLAAPPHIFETRESSHKMPLE
nr:hypothetical protein [Tanacetum cinerariifolium]